MGPRARLVALWGVVAGAHGLLLLNDGIYWDDWLVYSQLRRGDWASIDTMLRESGIAPANATFLKSFAFVPADVFMVHLAIFLLIALAASMMYLGAMEAGLGPLDSWLFAALATTFPGFQDWVLLITAPYVMDYAFFFTAAFLLLRAERASARRALAMRLGAGLLFVISFGVNSFLVVYYVALAVLLVSVLRHRSPRDLVRRLPEALAWMALAPVYWVLNKLLLPHVGLYAQYNVVQLDGTTIQARYADFIHNGLVGQFSESLATLRSPFTLAGVVLIGAGIWFWARRRHLPQRSRHEALVAMGIGALGLVMGAFPYAAVDLAPGLHGWTTRHDLLMAAPVALVLVGVARLAAPSGVPAVVAVAVLAALCLAFASSGVKDYLSIQARWVADRSVMQQLKSEPLARNSSVLWVHNEIQGPDPYYRFYEWSAMLEQVYGDQSRIGLDVAGYDATQLSQTQFFNDRYELARFDPAGCEADLTISYGPSYGSTSRLAVSYLFVRLFAPEQVQSLLGGAVTIHVTPHPSQSATDCSRP